MISTDLCCGFERYTLVVGRLARLAGREGKRVLTLPASPSIRAASSQSNCKLLSRDSIFWISGKPGSGKSAIMKYIAQSLGSGEIPLGDAAEPLIVLRFSFYYDGDEVQKSTKGLLYTLLNQCLETYRDLAGLIIPIYNMCEGKWSANRLLRALDMVLLQHDVRFRLLLILDALDECSGPPTALIELIDHIIDSSRRGAINVKICLFSRPCNVFEDAFRLYLIFEVHK